MVKYYLLFYKGKDLLRIDLIVIVIEFGVIEVNFYFINSNKFNYYGVKKISYCFDGVC